MKQKDIVFVGGIHGVGKSTLCSKFNNLLGISHYSASDLIKKKNKDLVNTSKTVIDVSGNQNVLIEAINEYVVEDKFLLDGHFALFNAEQDVIQIPLSTFESLSPIGIVLLIDDVKAIVKRIEYRDNIKHSLSKYESLQSVEIESARTVSDKLNIPLFIHDVNNELFELENFIKGI